MSTRQAYHAVVTVWQTDTEIVSFPVLGVFTDADAARTNAAIVAQAALTADAPALLTCPVTIAVFPVPDATIRELIAALRTARPDLIDPVARGRPREPEPAS